MESTEVQREIIDVVNFVVLDHREFSKMAFEEFQKSLNSKHIFIYEIESSKESDTWVIAISDIELDQDLLKLLDEQWKKKYCLSSEEDQ